MEKMIINPGSKDRAQKAINEIRERYLTGKPFVVTIEDAKEKRTDPQKGYYWSQLRQYGAWLGFNGREIEDVLHREMKCRVFGVERTLRHAGMVWNVPKCGTSENFSKEEYGRLIEEMIIAAGENGYTVEPPRENYG